MHHSRSASPDQEPASCRGKVGGGKPERVKLVRHFRRFSLCRGPIQTENDSPEKTGQPGNAGETPASARPELVLLSTLRKFGIRASCRRDRDASPDCAMVGRIKLRGQWVSHEISLEDGLPGQCVLSPDIVGGHTDWRVDRQWADEATDDAGRYCRPQPGE